MSDTTRKEAHTVTGKVYCKECGKFCGLSTSDGKGPYLDDCLNWGGTCKQVIELRVNVPTRPWEGDSGGGGDFIDKDGDNGGYHSIAVRAMEEGNG
jgi:hypothetical protein